MKFQLTLVLKSNIKDWGKKGAGHQVNADLLLFSKVCAGTVVGHFRHQIGFAVGKRAGT
jgi:hypothetical protein